jgi:hypothetical protein
MTPDVANSGARMVKSALAVNRNESKTPSILVRQPAGSDFDHQLAVSRTEDMPKHALTGHT